MEQYVITISRQFGSMGRSIARELSEILGIEFLDRDIVEATAKRMGLPVSVISDEEESMKSTFFRRQYPLGMGMSSLKDEIFLTQKNIIRDFAAKGSCIIVGRCADMILTDSLNLFIYAKMKDRIKRMLELESEAESDGKEMERRIREVDRKRKEYYQYYTGNTWGRAQNYHLCLDSGPVGVDGCLKAVLAYLGEEDKI